MSGWFAVKRGALSHELFKPVGKYSRFEAWIWLLENAQYKPTEIDLGGKPYVVPRGACCFSRRFLAQKWQWSRKSVETFLKQLERAKAVKLTEPRTGPARHQQRSQVTICNYDKYQMGGASNGAKDGAKNRTEDKQDKQINNIPVGESDDSAPIEVSVVTTALWQAGKQILASKGVSNPGSMIGRWLKSHPPVQILNAIEAAQKSGTEDPIPYITEALKGGHRDKPTKQTDRLNAFVSGARGTS